MKLPFRTGVLVSLVTVSACTSTPPPSGPTPVAAKAVVEASRSVDAAEINTLLPECIKAVSNMAVSESTVRSLGYRPTGPWPNVFQKVTSRNLVGLTGSFNQFSWRPGAHCELTIGMAERGRYDAFVAAVGRVLQQNGYTAQTRKTTFGSVTEFISSDGQFIAKTRLSRTGVVLATVRIEKR